MTLAEILSELSKLSPDELAEVQAKVDELTGNAWIDEGEPTEAEKAVLDAALEDYRRNPNSGTPWREALRRIRARTRRGGAV